MPGSIAARVMAYQRRMSGAPGPMFAGGEASNGEPVQVELLIDGVWTDITAYVMVRDDNGSISITRGRRDEGQTADHAVMNLLLDNRDGRFSPRNPTGTYYGLIGRNQPIRVSVPNGMGGKGYRFWGEVTAWPQKWDPTGTDVWVELEASGIIRRLVQAPPATYSPIRQAVTEPMLTGLRAYWPCEDAAGSLEIAAVQVSGAGSQMRFLDVAPEMAQSSLFGGSDPLPTFSSAAMRGGVAAYTDPTATQVRFLLYVPPEGAAADGNVVCRVRQLTDISVAEVTYFDLFYNAPGGAYVGVATAGGLSLESKGEDGTSFGAILHHTLDVRGKLLRVSIELQESGTSVVQTVRTLELLTGVETTASQTMVMEQLTRVRSVAFCVGSSVVTETAVGIPRGVIGHVTVQDTLTDIDDLGVRLSPVGEAAGRRIQRVCGEGGIAFDWVGDLDATAELGGQGRSNLLELAREAELADGGMLFESLAVMGLGYRTRESLCNQDPQLTLDYSGYNLSEVPLPVEDDRFVQNSVTVTVNDVSQTYTLDEGALSAEQPPAGVGLYGEEITLNLGDTETATLLDQAAWRVHLGTVDELRFPQISVNLSHASFASNPALKLAVLGLRPGDRVVVENPPSWLPPDDIDQIILGFEEEISHFEHRITFVCAPASPYRVGVLDDVSFRLDTDGSELVEAVSSSATSLTVAPTAVNSQRILWTTDTAEFPFDVRMGGEVMTVSGITSWLDDTFTRTESSAWGSPDVGGAWSTSGGAASDYSVNGNAGVHVLSTVDVSRRTSVTAVMKDFDLYCDITTSALATGASLFGAVTARMQNSTNMYMARLEFTTSNTVSLVLRKLVADVSTDLDSYTVPVTHVAGTYIRVRFQGYGNALKAKAWAATDAVEPPEWHVEGTDNVLSQAYSVGTRSITVTGNTNVNPEIRYDNYRVVNPQLFTVTRSVNGVSKSQSAGSDIRLAKPTILSL